MSRILFNDGVIQFRTGVQIIPEGSTADECICCGVECKCPDDSEQQTIANAVFAISGLPSSYSEEQFGSSTGEISMEITGLDSLNGSYNAILGQISDIVIEPDPCTTDTGECPLEKNEVCQWSITIPKVAIGGTYTYDFPSNSYTVTLSGFASVIISPTGDVSILCVAVFSSPDPIDGTTGISFEITKLGIQSEWRIGGSGSVVPLYRTGCETTNSIFHGLRSGDELNLVVNGPESRDSSAIPTSDLVIYAPFGHCGGVAFYRNEDNTEKLDPVDIAASSISVTSCATNGGSGDALSATYSLTVTPT